MNNETIAPGMGLINAKDLKRQLQQDIINLLVAFEGQTGLTVLEEIRYKKVTMGNGVKLSAHLDIDVVL